MDRLPERYGRSVASAVASVLDPHLVGAYLHGSAVLGGFDTRRSDVDVVVVCAGPTTAAQRSAIAEELGDRRLPCPARGLELSVVTLRTTQHPTARPPFEMHVTTAPEDTKVVDGHDHAGDPDLVLHFAVCRRAGRALGRGRPPTEVFAAVGDDLIIAQLVTELRWGAEHGDGEYAVLNACRAWRFVTDGALVSKIDGGRWALERVPDANRELIETALDRQRCVPAAELDPDAVRRFTRQALSRLTRPALRTSPPALDERRFRPI